MKNTINLNFGWKYTMSYDDCFVSRTFDDTSWSEVNIPHTNIETPYNYFDEEMYQFVSCYRKSVNIPEEYKCKKLILEFQAVANYARVFVNGNFAFEHKGSYTAFSGDIAQFVEFGKDNTITVMVDSTEREEIPPFGGVVDYLVYGGIYREVFLYVHDQVYAENLLATPINVLTQPQVQLKLQLNTSVENLSVDFAIQFEGKEIATQNTVANGNNITCDIMLPNAKLWDIDNPNLYSVSAKFNNEEITTRFGMRECKFKRNGFFLNGKKIKICGLNRHQSYPYVGYAMPASAQIADAVLLKEHLGVNLARTCHYPNSHHFLNKCDEIGLMVFTEIPGWQFISKKSEWRELCLQHIREMIIQDYNHPSIILWGVRINESSDDNELYTATNKLAHELDSSRQTGGVRCIPHSKLLEDVYTYNDFVHKGTNSPTAPKFIVTNPKNPYLITEFNGHMFPTKSFDHEKRRQEHAIRHAKIINKTFGSKGTSGCIAWCMSDYNTHKDFGSGDKICYHGVTDMFRMDKLAANTYKILQEKKPVLEISSNMEIGDNDGGQIGAVYMFTNCDEVRLIKNGKQINTFNMTELRKKSSFKHLPYPPVELSDTIGNQLEYDETYKFTKKDATKLKKVLLAVKKYGPIPGIVRNIFSVLSLIVKYKLNLDGISALFGKYCSSWGVKQVSYKFEGYINGKLVVTTEKGSAYETQLSVKCDSQTLCENETYDVVRIGIQALSQIGNVLNYDNSIIKVKTNGIVDIIGPSEFSLIGGQRAVWVKTNGQQGKALVTITSPDHGEQTIQIDVTKK